MVAQPQDHTETPLFPRRRGCGASPMGTMSFLAIRKRCFPLAGKQQSKFIVLTKTSVFFLYAEMLQVRILIGKPLNNGSYKMVPGVTQPGLCSLLAFKKIKTSIIEGGGVGAERTGHGLARSPMPN